MGNHSVEVTWCDSRPEVEARDGNVRNRRPTGMPGGLVATLLWEFASSSSSPWSK